MPKPRVRLLSRHRRGGDGHLVADGTRRTHRVGGVPDGLETGAQRVLLSQGSRNPIMKWLVPKVLPLFLQSPLLPLMQRRIFFGAPLPPLDPAFSFREPAVAG